MDAGRVGASSWNLASQLRCMRVGHVQLGDYSVEIADLLDTRKHERFFKTFTSYTRY